MEVCSWKIIELNGYVPANHVWLRESIHVASNPWKWSLESATKRNDEKGLNVRVAVTLYLSFVFAIWLMCRVSTCFVTSNVQQFESIDCFISLSGKSCLTPPKSFMGETWENHGFLVSGYQVPSRCRCLGANPKCAGQVSDRLLTERFVQRWDPMVLWFKKI